MAVGYLEARNEKENHNKLKMWAISDALPLEAARAPILQPAKFQRHRAMSG